MNGVARVERSKSVTLGPVLVAYLLQIETNGIGQAENLDL